MQRVVYRPEEGIVLDAKFFLPEDWSDAFPPVFVMIDEEGRSRRSTRSRPSAPVSRTALSSFPTSAGLESRPRPSSRSPPPPGCSTVTSSTSVWDVLRTVDLLSERYSTGQQIGKEQIVVWGRGAFGLVALIAAALDLRIAVAGATGLTSLEDLLVENSRTTPMAYRYRPSSRSTLMSSSGSRNPAPTSPPPRRTPCSIDAALALARMSAAGR